MAPNKSDSTSPGLFSRLRDTMSPKRVSATASTPPLPPLPGPSPIVPSHNAFAAQLVAQADKSKISIEKNKMSDNGEYAGGIVRLSRKKQPQVEHNDDSQVQCVPNGHLSGRSDTFLPTTPSSNYPSSAFPWSSPPVAPTNPSHNAFWSPEQSTSRFQQQIQTTRKSLDTALPEPRDDFSASDGEDSLQLVPLKKNNENTRPTQRAISEEKTQARLEAILKTGSASKSSQTTNARAISTQSASPTRAESQSKSPKDYIFNKLGLGLKSSMDDRKMQPSAITQCDDGPSQSPTAGVPFKAAGILGEKSLPTKNRRDIKRPSDGMSPFDNEATEFESPNLSRSLSAPSPKTPHLRYKANGDGGSKTKQSPLVRYSDSVDTDDAIRVSPLRKVNQRLPVRDLLKANRPPPPAKEPDYLPRRPRNVNSLASTTRSVPSTPLPREIFDSPSDVRGGHAGYRGKPVIVERKSPDFYSAYTAFTNAKSLPCKIKAPKETGTQLEATSYRHARDRVIDHDVTASPSEQLRPSPLNILPFRRDDRAAANSATQPQTASTDSTGSSYPVILECEDSKVFLQRRYEAILAQEAAQAALEPPTPDAIHSDPAIVLLERIANEGFTDWQHIVSQHDTELKRIASFRAEVYSRMDTFEELQHLCLAQNKAHTKEQQKALHQVQEGATKDFRDIGGLQRTVTEQVGELRGIRRDMEIVLSNNESMAAQMRTLIAQINAQNAAMVNLIAGAGLPVPHLNFQYGQGTTVTPPPEQQQNHPQTQSNARSAHATSVSSSVAGPSTASSRHTHSRSNDAAGNSRSSSPQHADREPHSARRVGGGVGGGGASEMRNYLQSVPQSAETRANFGGVRSRHGSPERIERRTH